jgi:hypothetical protein
VVAAGGEEVAQSARIGLRAAEGGRISVNELRDMHGDAVY